MTKRRENISFLVLLVFLASIIPLNLYVNAADIKDYRKVFETYESGEDVLKPQSSISITYDGSTYYTPPNPAFLSTDILPATALEIPISKLNEVSNSVSGSFVDSMGQGTKITGYDYQFLFVPDEGESEGIESKVFSDPSSASNAATKWFKKIQDNGVPGKAYLFLCVHDDQHPPGTGDFLNWSDNGNYS